jgi:hypothetical protein
MNYLIRALVMLLVQRLKSKTYLFATATIVLGAVLHLMPLVQAALTPEVYGMVVSAIGVVIAVLREVTSEPLNDKTQVPAVGGTD